MLKSSNNIFIVGIKGVAMANLAVIFKKMGKNVYGSDTKDNQITDELLMKNNIAWSIGFNIKDIPESIDTLIYSAAHGGTDNPQVIESKNRKVKTISQAKVLAYLIKQFKCSIAVAGCHGKTTTASFLSYALLKLNVNPSYIVGAPCFTDYDGGNYSKSKYFVVEADEYGINPPHDNTSKLLLFNPKYIVCTNIDFDHPDIFKDIKAVKDTFLSFFKGKELILCADDKNINSLLPKLNKHKYITYGYSNKADYMIVNFKANTNGSAFTLKFNRQLLNFKISLFGKKNALNTAAVIVLLLKLGFKYEDIKNAIRNFKGVKRRFELIYSDNTTFLFDDYAHHPEEIKATIEAVRQRFKNKRLIIIFQSHTYSRTKALLHEFGKSLSLADKTYVLPIFSSAREKSEEFNISEKDIAKASDKGNILSFPTFNKLIEELPKIIKKGDVIITMGAGDVYKLKDDIIRAIKQIKQ